MNARLVAVLLAAAVSFAHAARPNFLIILADDMGFSDAGCYGGEIPTPQLDSLAAGGLRFTQFYNTARCWPTRAALMTGYYPQQIRMDPPRGRLPQWTRTVPQYLKPLGYRCYQSGKWHVQGAPKVVADAGFDHSYVLDDHDRNFHPRRIIEDDKPLPPVATNAGYYTTVAFADHTIRCLKEHAEKFPGQPFLSYLAFTVPHFPLQAPPEDIARHRDRYLAGWDAIRAQRWKRQREMGLINCALSDRDPTGVPHWNLAEQQLKSQIDPGEVARAVAWDTLNAVERRYQATKMAIHAAMIDRMDREIGRVIGQLKAMGAYENTVILFASDNGASGEQINRGDKHDPAAPLGSGGSYLCLGPGWSTAANTPMRLHKSWVHEGGIATPLIVHWPAGIKNRGELRHDPGHIIDLLPTLLELAGTTPGNSWNTLTPPPLPGRSLVPAFAKDRAVTRDFLYFHHDANRALRIGDWKLVARRPDTNTWELYDLSTDRGEMVNLATRQPERVQTMAARWATIEKEFRAAAGPGSPMVTNGNPFFAMDTGTRGAPAAVAPLLKELGFHGLGGSPGNAANMARALEQRGLHLFNVYLTLAFDAATPALTDSLRKTIDDLEGRESALWIAVNKVTRDGKAFALSSTDGDAIALERLREISDYAQLRGVRIALYPHTGFWLERASDAARLARASQRPNIGATFNLCHFLKVEGDIDPTPALRAAMPKLFFVTINGADAGDTRKLGWKELIQPLGSGSYDVAAFLEKVRAAGFRGPIGLQHYGIAGEPRDNLQRSINAWREMNKRPEPARP
jgi:arylsulfatase